MADLASTLVGGGLTLLGGAITTLCVQLQARGSERRKTALAAVDIAIAEFGKLGEMVDPHISELTGEALTEWRDEQRKLVNLLNTQTVLLPDSKLRERLKLLTVALYRPFGPEEY